MAMFGDEAGTVFSLDSIDTPQSRRVASTSLVDLRGSPRIEVSLPAEIWQQGNQPVLAMITNLSRSGLRAEGSGDLVESLFGGEVLQDNHASVLAQLHFYVPENAGSDVQIVVQGATVYARQDGGGYQVGIKFSDFSCGREALLDYLASRLNGTGLD